MQALRILFSDEDLVVFEKPAGLAVHPPERPDSTFKARRSAPDVIRILRNQLGRKVYPVHRLDRATHGVMVMGLSGGIAGKLQEQFKTKAVTKSYLALCRGWMGDEGRMEAPLADEEGGSEKASVTEFRTLHRFELPIPSSRHATSRFSLMQAWPRTGRTHQIRRHFRKENHPLIGDTVYGDGKQNRLWRELLKDSRLFLMAWSLRFHHPATGEPLRFRARFSKLWHPAFDLAQFCPLEVDLKFPLDDRAKISSIQGI